MFRNLAAVFMILIMMFNLAACKGAEAEEKRFEAKFLMLFDTVIQVIGYSASEEEFNEQANMIYGNLKKYHQLYDIYQSYEGINNLKTVNDQAGIAPVKVDQKIIDLLLFSKEAYEMTGGEVNIAFGSVLRIWHEHRETGVNDPEKAELPDQEALKEASMHTGIDKVIIDTEKSTVYLADSDMRLDVGAIAKGYAAEQAARLAGKNGFTNGLISIGGNVRAIGTRGDGTLWRVGVQNPFDQNGEEISRLSLTDASLVTSGVYERFYTVEGKKYHHIIDPDTLYPSEYFESVSILCPDSGLADALSTALFNMPFQRGFELIESLPDTEALWVFNDGSVQTSSNFEDFIVD